MINLWMKQMKHAVILKNKIESMSYEAFCKQRGNRGKVRNQN